jgi:toxin ParE1/3/4
VRLRYTPRAAAELDEVLAYIEARSPQGARRVQMRIQLIIDLLVSTLMPVSVRANAVCDA